MNRSTVAVALSAVVLAPLVAKVTTAEDAAQTHPAKESRAYLHSYNLPSSGIALEGYCPVAYFAVNKPVRGKPAYASRHDGVTYYFVSADAKKLFEKNPEKYLPAYGGWCAYGMHVKDKFPVDPTKFKIVDGRLLLFLKNKHVNALELWNSGDEKQQLANADAHWQTVSP